MKRRGPPWKLKRRASAGVGATHVLRARVRPDQMGGKYLFRRRSEKLLSGFRPKRLRLQQRCRLKALDAVAMARILDGIAVAIAPARIGAEGANGRQPSQDQPEQPFGRLK
jgi:hypothetical protein